MIITGKKFSKPEMSRVKNGDVILPESKQETRVRLDQLLVKLHPEFNRSTLQGFIKQGRVSVDKMIYMKPSVEIVTEVIENGEKREVTHEVVLKVPEKQKKPELKVLYEDKNVCVVNKPVGMLSMTKGEFSTEPTLEDYGLLVHRLDRGTSGVVILARNEETQKMLRRQFQERRAHKTYYAITEGIPKLKEAKIDLPIARNLKHPTTFMVDPGGKPAQTLYEVEKVNRERNLAKIRLQPISGRTHQLRVHLKYLGCPILGDKVYNSESKIQAERLFLHASALEITIPGASGGERTIFTAPLPPEFDQELA